MWVETISTAEVEERPDHSDENLPTPTDHSNEDAMQAGPSKE